jgi:phospholipase C
MSQSETQSTNGLDTFDHVVVLMLENRSFDNLLGYLYSQQYPVPHDKKFEGVDGKGFSNPIPTAWQFTNSHGTLVTEVPVAPISGVDVDLKKISPPYPDPGEDYPHVNTQLFFDPRHPYNPAPQPFNQPPYNLPSPVPVPPPMTGFVTDYILNYIHTEFPPPNPAPSPDQAFYDHYKYIMECYDPAELPVLSGLAREFAVFDHWFCSVPSETICNRNFWHAGTSWGHVINPGPPDDTGDQCNKPNTDAWVWDTVGETLFSQLSLAAKDWKIYSDNKIPLSAHENFSLPVTPLLHMLNFLPLIYFDRPDLFNTLESFKTDCANGQLPAYSFIEPNFFNPHNDMHPSTPEELVDGPQKVSSVLLGEALVWEIYHAIFTSPRLWDNTLLVITFDEHGGCHDHVSPPGDYGGQQVDPAKIATPPDLNGYTAWDGFGFDRLGLRVPMIMVSPYINKNTIINTPLSHTSFLKTVHGKWGLDSLSARELASPGFDQPGLLWPTLQRAHMSDMPKLTKPVVPADNTDYSKAVLTALAKAIMGLIKELWCKAFPQDCPTMEMRTHGDAAAFLSYAIRKAKAHLGRADAAQINEQDGMLLLRAIAVELQKQKLR